MQQRDGISGPTTVPEGGTVQVEVRTGARELRIYIPSGQLAFRVPVVNGLAEFQVPPSVRGGSSVLVTDMGHPEPASILIVVVGNQ